MQQIQEKSDSIKKSLDLSTPLQQQKSLNVSRKIIDFKELKTLDSITKKESVQKFQSQVKQAPRKTTTKPRPRREIIQDSISSIKPKSVVAIEEIPVRTEVVLPEKQIYRKNADWALGIIILCLVIIASVRIIFNTYLKQLINATINYGTAFRLFRERTFNIFHAAFRLDLMFYIALALFCQQSLSIFEIPIGTLNSITTYIFCLVAVIAYFLLKRLLYILVAIVTESQNETSEYLFNINIYNRILGLVLLVVVMIIAFVPIHNVKLISFSGISIIAAFYCLSLFRGSRILLKKQFSISYLILYLCTLEFLPLLIIYKVVLG